MMMTNNKDNSRMDVEDAIATLHVMRRQEETGYKVVDYLQHHQQIRCQNPLTPLPIGANLSPLSPVTADCRYKMAEWCYQVIDFCLFDRDTVSIAMNYLDRFLSTSIGDDALDDRRMFQLVAMQCLYTAVKIHEPQAVDPKSFALLSRGQCTAEEIQAMESITLDALDWRMNPPTAVTFLQYFFELIPSDIMSPTLRATICDLAQFQTELAATEYIFVTVPASTIAFASLMNATECIDESMARYLQSILFRAKIIDCNSPSMHETQQRLYEIITERPGNLLTVPATSPSMDVKMAKTQSCVHDSPRSIVGRCQQQQQQQQRPKD